MASTVPVSCACLTYGRPEVLEEAIYSFLQQDYPGQKELIVLNDYAKQALVFDHPQVQVINVPKRFRTVGEKQSVAIALCSHDLIFIWDDDDIYLPQRLSFSVQKFDAGKGFFKPDKAWFWSNGELSGPARNVFHSGSCWSRELFNTVRGYACQNNGYDQEIEAQLDQKVPGAASPYDIRPEDIYYIYRWGRTGSYHMSGYGQAEYDQVATFVDNKINQGEIQQGQIQLQPHWQADYAGLVRDYLARLVI